MWLSSKSPCHGVDVTFAQLMWLKPSARSCCDNGQAWAKIIKDTSTSSMARVDSVWGSAAFRCWKVQSRRRTFWKEKSKIWPLLARGRPTFQRFSDIAEQFSACGFECLWTVTEGETHPDNAEQRTGKGFACRRKDRNDTWWQAELWFVGNLS